MRTLPSASRRTSPFPRTTMLAVTLGEPASRMANLNAVRPAPARAADRASVTGPAVSTPIVAVTTGLTLPSAAPKRTASVLWPDSPPSTQSHGSPVYGIAYQSFPSSEIWTVVTGEASFVA